MHKEFEQPLLSKKKPSNEFPSVIDEGSKLSNVNTKAPIPPLICLEPHNVMKTHQWSNPGPSYDPPYSPKCCATYLLLAHKIFVI